ncbi:MAG: GIY-YIG nuclease family protein [Betaproteobacteria bacterium]|nr:GIY-YIG nuclease family protein [Betaproteobacteria bacterium]
MNEADWYLYLLECGDGSLYCGIAKNVERRVAEHACGKGARYTRGRGPFRIVWQTSEPLTRSAALKLELKIKAMSREQKLTFVAARESN